MQFPAASAGHCTFPLFVKPSPFMLQLDFLPLIHASENGRSLARRELAGSSPGRSAEHVFTGKESKRCVCGCTWRTRSKCLLATARAALSAIRVVRGFIFKCYFVKAIV